MAKRPTNSPALPMSSNAIVKQPGALLADALPVGYDQFLADVKSRIVAAQIRAALAVSTELIQLYWTIGRDIVSRQAEQGWGTKVIDKLAEDLARAFPGIDGFSRTNIYRMRSFYQAWPAETPQQAIVPQPAGQFAALPTHSIVPQLAGQLNE